MTTSHATDAAQALGADAVRRAGAVIVAIWLVGGAVGLGLAPGTGRTVVVNLTFGVLLGALALGSLRRLRLGVGARLPWRLIAAVGMCGVMVSVVYVAQAFLTGAAASALAAVARLLTVATVSLLVLALVALAARRRPGAASLRGAVLDGVVSAGSWFLLLWLLGFREVAQALEPSLAAAAALSPFIAAATTLGVIAYLRLTESLRGPLGFFAAWAALSVIAEAGYALTYAAGGWYPGHPQEILSLGRFVPLALAPWAKPAPREKAQGPGLFPDLVVYGPVTAALVISVVMGAAGTLVYDAVTVSLFLVVGLGILLRQLLALRTVRQLSRSLESKVEHRTAALAESEARYRTVVESQTEFVVRWLPDGTRTFVNEAYCRFFGGTRDELVGTSFYPLVAPEDREQIEAKIARLTPAEPAATEEHRVLMPNGTFSGWQQWTDRAFFDDDGHILELLSVGRDVTDRKVAEEALERSERRLRALFEQSGELLSLLSPGGTLSMVNRAALELLMPDEDPGIGSPLWSTPWWRHSEALQGDLQRWIRRCAGGEPVEVEVVHYDARGAPRIIDMMLDPIRDGDGEVVLLLARGRDVTEQRELQGEVLEIAARERQRIGQDLHDGLGQRLTGTGFLAGAVVRRLEKRGLAEAEEVRALRDQLTDALNETRFLARGLLPVSFDAHGLTGALFNLATQVSELFGIRCRAHADPGLDAMQEDVAADLYQIAREAVTNSVRHGKSDEIEIRLTGGQDGPILSVRDNGVGMPREPAGKAGLGLRIMRYRSQRIGASLEVTPAPHGGTLVRCVAHRDMHRFKGRSQGEPDGASMGFLVNGAPGAPSPSGEAASAKGEGEE